MRVSKVTVVSQNGRLVPVAEVNSEIWPAGGDRVIGSK